jgi:hypothetical protein
MTVVPLRNLGKLGVITDVEPYDLPPEAFSMGVNVRFEEGRVERGPVFGTLGAFAADPAHLVSYEDASGTLQTLYTRSDGHVYNWTNGGETDKSPASGWTPAATFESLTTHTFVNDVLYINRQDHVPFYRATSASGLFGTLNSYNSGNGLTQFDATWRFKSLRSLAGCLIGINCTEGIASLPKKYRWSDFTDYGVPPRDWDQGSTTSSSGANTIAELDGELVDGWPLRDALVLYGDKETWLLEYVGDNEMFRPTRLFGRGVVNVNCVVEFENKHYVFGNGDIWMHDGVGDQSLATGRTRKFIFRSMVSGQEHLAFVTHNPALNEILFCYVSNDQFCAFPYGPPYNNVGCNRAAVYNYASQTWYFYDLPYVTAACMGRTTSSLQFDQATDSYSSITGSFSSIEGDSNEALLMAGLSATAPIALSSRLRSLESYKGGSAVSTIDAAATAKSYLERHLMDLDEVGAELRGYKLCSSIYPQGRFSADAAPITFTFGSCDHPSVEPFFGAPQTFDETEYKLDHNEAGRFLSLKATFDDYRHFTLSGIDFDIIILGN